MNILTAEEKQILSLISKYLKSQGLREGSIEIDMDYGELHADAIDNYDYFNNSYNVEVPEELTKILRRILEVIIDKELIQAPDVDDINYERLSITLDAIGKELVVEHYYSYYDEAESTSQEWTYDDYDDSEDNPLIQMFDDISEIDNLSPEDNVLHLRYNGSGDSGYIEDYFEGGKNVPSSVEDWCYRQLENSHGGWEINEGSQGEFIFDLKNKTVTLDHTYNTEESSTDTVFEEKF
jgi:hypothetical protein